MFLLMATISIPTSCDCERSFSRLRTINTYLRSTMSVDRLNGHSLLYIVYIIYSIYYIPIHKDIYIYVDYSYYSYYIVYIDRL